MRIDRLDHSNKIFSKTNWKYIKKICAGKEKSMVSPILTLDLTSICNYKCSYCIDKGTVNHGEYKEIEWEDLKYLLSDLREHGCNCIELTGGGEPTLYSYFGEFLEFTAEAGYKLALVTNGSQLYKYAKNFKKSSIDWLRISLDAATASTYNLIHGLAGCNNFNQVVEAIEYLAQDNVVGISFIITNDNYNEIFQAAELAKKVHVKYFEIKPLLENELKDIYSYNTEVIKAIKEQLKKIEYLKDEEFSIIFPDSLSLCILEKTEKQKKYDECKAAYLRTVLTPNGVYPCSYHRGMELKQVFPKTTEELLHYRNEVISKVNPQVMCNHYCARNNINSIIYDIISIQQAHPEMLDYLGWPIDYGEDVLWI